MKKIFHAALFLGLALGLNTAVSAQDNNSQSAAPNAQEKSGRKDKAGKRGGNHEGKANRGMGGLNQLNLTDAQRQQIRNIRQSNQASDAVRAEMRQLMQAKRDGNSLTGEQKARLQTLKQQVKADRDRQQQQILAILTPEQRQQWEQNKAEGRERRQNQSSPQDY